MTDDSRMTARENSPTLMQLKTSAFVSTRHKPYHDDLKD
jgi:hypothetical protein